MKYIVMEVELTKGHKLEIPILFPDILVHDTIAKQMVHMLYRQFLSSSDVRCVAAGFVASIDMQISCHGRSESLNIASRGEIDSDLIKMTDYGSMHKW